MYLLKTRSMSALAFISLLSLHAYAADWSALVKETMPSVVVLHGYDSNGEAFTSATGFSIGKNRIVTCWHAIDHADVVRVIATTKAGKKHNITHLLSRSVELDLAVMRHDGDAIPALELASEEADQGSPAIVIGSPREYEFSVTDGTISSWRNNDKEVGRREVQFTAPVSPGNSGGPLFSKNGKVLGVISWIRVDRGSQNLNFAIGYSHVSDLIKEAERNKKPLFFLDRFKGLKRGDMQVNPDGIEGAATYSPNYEDLAVEYIYQIEYFVENSLRYIETRQKYLREKQRTETNRDARKEISKQLQELGRAKAKLKRNTIRLNQDAYEAKQGSIGEITLRNVKEVYIYEVLSDSEFIASLQYKDKAGKLRRHNYIRFVNVSAAELKVGEKYTFSGIYECIEIVANGNISSSPSNSPQFYQLDENKLDQAMADVTKDKIQEIRQEVAEVLDREAGQRNDFRRPHYIP